MLPITLLVLSKNKYTTLSHINPSQILVGKNLQELNELLKKVKNEWIFYLKDNETILQINEDLERLIQVDERYGCLLLQDDVVLKETRLWKSSPEIMFKNIVFEKINIEPTKILDIVIYREKINQKETKEQIEIWRKNNPLSTDAHYYAAFSALAEKNFKEFKSLITYYLFHARKDIPSVMARYYLALIQALVDQNSEEAIKNIIVCLIENPLMAEFWCLLGDIHLLAEKFNEAILFYDNAMLLGSRRLKLDLWPMQISKYNTYPSEMIEKCKNLLKNSALIAEERPNHSQ